ncbi:MAG: hypothetical protein MUC43_20165, partial [Pirellula sp.]|nr:hypothetical protein [Pirellula sp.]
MNDQATIQTECLSADTMRSYWQGLAADHEVETIEQHLQNCPQCMALFKRFENANEQVDILRDLFAADIKHVMPRPILSGLPHENEPSLAILVATNKADWALSRCKNDWPWWDGGGCFSGTRSIASAVCYEIALCPQIILSGAIS